MDACLSDNDLGLIINDEVPAERLTAWKQHLRICDTCGTKLANLNLNRDASRPSSGEITESGINETFKIGLEPNVLIGDFRIEKRIASGGMGVVYRAHQVSLNRTVALKVLTYDLLANASAIERFHREAQAAAKLQHPNIVSIYAEGIESRICYYAMELVEGQTLAQFIQSHAENDIPVQSSKDGCSSAGENALADSSSPSSPTRTCSTRSRFDRIASIIADAADALEYAHQNGVIHRDLKPANLMLTQDGHLKITDFGIARVLDDKALTLTQSFMGTPLYMSPEQIRGDLEKTDHRTDIYSLGASLYELLTLQPLYEGLETVEQVMTHILNKSPRKPRSIDKKIPVDLETICLKAIEPDVERRYNSAGEFADDLRRYLKRQVIKAKPAGITDRVGKFVSRHRIPSALAAVIIVAVCMLSWLGRNTLHSHHAEQLIPQIAHHIENKEFFEAYLLAKKAEQLQAKNLMLEELWSELSREYSIHSTPDGADVFFADYYDSEPDWIYVGRSPLDKARLPYGAYRWKVKKEGYETVESVRVNATANNDLVIHFDLQKKGRFPSDMIYVPKSDFRPVLSGVKMTSVSMPEFLIDKYEVTNRQFKEFVDAGGYRDSQYWKYKFVKEDAVLDWAEAMEEFRDSTGQYGPSTWKSSHFAEGEADHPVSGVSWFEAAAYAEFKGKELPTVFHWIKCVIADDDPETTKALSNFDEHPAAVGTYKGMGRYGLYDAGGNVREWCHNATDGSGKLRYICGGAYGELSKIFTEKELRQPWDRDRRNGFRCARYLGGTENLPSYALGPIEKNDRDFASFTPVSDDIFRSYMEGFYSYDRVEFNSVVEDVAENLESCRVEKITFDAAYSDERVIAYLYIPKGVTPPYQTVVYFPGGGAHKAKSSEKFMSKVQLPYIIKSGRAMLFPVYKGTYERRYQTSLKSDSVVFRDMVILMSKDLRRSVDYLQTRNDIDIENLAYVGTSWGASFGTIMMATEKRFQTGVYIAGGICPCKRLPSADPANFASRVTIPVLMINGKYDFIFSYASQRYLFNSLSAPQSHKKHIVYPGGHIISPEFREHHENEILNWLDRYLGPVELTEQPVANSVHFELDK